MKKKTFLGLLIVIGIVGIEEVSFASKNFYFETPWTAPQNSFNQIQLPPDFKYLKFVDKDEYNNRNDVFFEDSDNRLVKLNKLANIKELSTESGSNFDVSIAGVSMMKNLEVIDGEPSPIYDISPLYPLRKLKSIQLNMMNTNDLRMLKNNKGLEYVEIWQDNNTYCTSDLNETIALTDISDLSQFKKLKSINIRVTDQRLPKVSISKKENNYKLMDPIILSDQFKNKTKYSISLEQNFDENTENEADNSELCVTDSNELRWENIPINSEYLTFTAKANEEMFHYSGEIKIPIRWID